ncbi:hypothetical protein GGX14DRAFT_555955 [Mycena pura]|uniref:Uncharacterized protein n=1 Tax=Mycena pura TaxID=153505 RepID=A0AAD7E4V1_9AGAR|nr:hypothetical protein GGX14DRAFT_555955 [Mycena pura]
MTGGHCKSGICLSTTARAPPPPRALLSPPPGVSKLIAPHAAKHYTLPTARFPCPISVRRPLPTAPARSSRCPLSAVCRPQLTAFRRPFFCVRWLQITARRFSLGSRFPQRAARHSPPAAPSPTPPTWRTRTLLVACACSPRTVSRRTPAACCARRPRRARLAASVLFKSQVSPPDDHCPPHAALADGARHRARGHDHDACPAALWYFALVTASMGITWWESFAGADAPPCPVRLREVAPCVQLSPSCRGHQLWPQQVPKTPCFACGFDVRLKRVLSSELVVSVTLAPRSQPLDARRCYETAPLHRLVIVRLLYLRLKSVSGFA